MLGIMRTVNIVLYDNVICDIVLLLLQLTAVHNQMHSKGGYEHKSHVPTEATPSGQPVSLIVSFLAVAGWALI